MKKNLYYILFALLFVSNAVLAQNKAITGKVTDKSGPLPGASIVEKGQITNGTMTDINGNFSLPLKGSSQTLVISMIGYLPKEVNVAGQTSVTVLLAEDSKNLDEVVVVGYGEQKKVTMTGAVSVVSGEVIRENPSASLQNSLVGKMPGFFSQQQSGRPGGDGADFFIRGISSYNGNNQPLIIVDDIEFTYEQFSRLDANEIESVSILKDASTTAVYGIKGANGVLLVTTRRGVEGKPKISIRTEYSMQQPTMFPKFLGSYESALLHNQARKNDAEFNGTTYTPAFSDEAVEAFRTGSNPYFYPDVNWKEVLFNDFAKQSRTNLDVSGGTEKVKYFVSMGYLDQGGMLKNFGKESGVNNSYYHRRMNYRSNLDIAVNKDFSLRLDLYGNIGEINNPVMPGTQWGYNDPFYEYSSYLSLSPYAHPTYNPDGSIAYRLGLHPGRYEGPNSIIARLAYGGYSRNHENNMNLVSSANYKLDAITKGLSFKGTLSYASTYGYTRSMTRSTFPSYIWNPTTDTYTSYPNRTYRLQRFFDDYNAGGTTRVLTMQAILNYDRTFGDHHVYGLALMNQSSDIRGGRRSDLNYKPIGFKGFTGRLGYDYKDKYLFQLNAGYNGSPLFSSANRFGFFPAVSAGWNISEEPFFKDNITFVNFLKVRSSYGLVGNDRLGSGFSYYYEQVYTNGGSASFGTQHNNYGGIVEGALPNFDVTWEKEKKFDVGMELRFFKDRLTTNLDYFRNERYDILTYRSGAEGTVSDIFGQTSPPFNLGRVENKGYEFEMVWRDNIGQDFSYNLRAMYSVADNKILFRDEPQAAFPYQRRTGNNINTQMAYVWTGTFYESREDIAKSPKVEIGTARPGDLKYVDMNSDGVINAFDRAYVGNPANVPPTTFAFEFGVGYKGFSLKSMFQGAKDFNVGGVAENIQFLGSNMQEIFQHAWTPELGNNAQYPVLSENMGISTPRGSTVSTFWFIPGDYIRWRTAEFSYTLPTSFVQRMKLQNIRIYTTGNNLLTWSKIKDLYQMDPEIASGRDRITYPPQRVFNLGLSVTF
ncbi:SusC/RagA family TonB-linked outer membrane protein [Rufibacter soli]|jgi:TonB-linked SusC/RagA family outer membrane protein